MNDKVLTPDICVIGAGAAGLSIAAGAVQLGADTVLVEAGQMGGDCLNYGCVPSKSLLAAGRAARGGAACAHFGIHYAAPSIDFPAVNDHVHSVIAGLAPHDSVERFEGLGVTVLRGTARFVSPREVAVAQTLVRARRFVVATGSRPVIPPVPGLEQTAYLTNETVFALRDRPEHLIVLGGGPIGCELGQAFRHLGSRVTVVEMDRLLSREDTEAVDVLRCRLRADGITLLESTRATGAATLASGEVELTLAGVDDRPTRVRGSHLLVATGRRPNLEDLDLDKAAIVYDRSGITVDARLRSSNRRVYAAGDVAGGPQFTHVAASHAGVVIRNALFRLPARIDYTAVPAVTYTDPELAQVGLTEAEAREQGRRVRTLTWSFEDNDRASIERRNEGFIKVMVTPAGRIIGATIVGAQAGELILPWTLAIAQRLRIGAMATLTAPYPTRGEAGKRAAGTYFTNRLFTPRTRWLVRLLARLG